MIKRLAVVIHDDAGSTSFEAECGKGAYVRALARDIGRILGCFGHVTALRRTRVGPFHEARAVTLQEIVALAASEADGGGERLSRFLVPCEMALSELPELLVSPADAASLVRGQPIVVRGRDAPIMTGPVYATSKGRLIALGELSKGALHPTRVFNLG